MGCGCKKRKVSPPTTTTSTSKVSDVKESVKVVINKYNKVKK